MRYARWLDHLPIWLAYGAVATTGIYEPWELVAMALPLAFAIAVEAMRMDLGRWRQPLEFLALALVLLDFFARHGFFGVVVHTLFLLCGLRLALPREVPQRRQLLLMGFLLFLTTAISTTDLAFLAWALAWMAGAGLQLLQLSWEHSASLRRGPTLRPPYGRMPLWVLSALGISSLFFLILPRLTVGWRPLPAMRAALAGLQSGLSDKVDLAEAGSIKGGGEVVMRVIPPADLSASQLAALPQQAAYFRGFALESVQGMAWKAVEGTRGLNVVSEEASSLSRHAGALSLELYLSPDPQRLLPLPYGTGAVALPIRTSLRTGQGGALRLPFALASGVPVKVFMDPAAGQAIGEYPPPSPNRLAWLTKLAPEHAAAVRAAQAWAPVNATPQEAADRFSAHLRSFGYTLDNPSGAAANPLTDFLERTKAGHCEYFASSLALMLRARGIPARVVNGYRLGPWVPEGGYFLVTQNEAHAWTEYWDGAARTWRVADATPPTSAMAGQGLAAAWSRWSDVLTFRWNRYVVRFSDEDQQAGLGKARDLAMGWHWQWRRPSGLAAWILLFALAAWAAIRFRGRWAGAEDVALKPHGLRELRPLLARTRNQAPPFEGETLRAWMARLAELRPDRASPLAALADAAERAAYGSGGPDLRALAREEARAWKRG
jgi:hypothetical protein